MKHHIIVKWKAEAGDKSLLLRKVRELYNAAGEECGVDNVTLVSNCIDRDNRYDLMIILDMKRENLPVWDASSLHKEWKETYSSLIEKKAIFDSEDYGREIRKTRPEELDDVLRIYAHGREIMKRTGNLTQWGDNRPPLESIKRDIDEGNSYVITENGEIRAVFAFITGPDPTYSVIDGAWLNDNPYGAVHRIASDERTRGVLRSAVEYASGYVDELRIDTHRDNVIMRHLISKLGFTECGIIITDDGTERIAFQKHIERE